MFFALQPRLFNTYEKVSQNCRPDECIICFANAVDDKIYVKVTRVE